MQIEVDKEEVEFLLEALQYAEMRYDESVQKYQKSPEEFRTAYFTKNYPEKKQMYQRIRGKLRDAKKSSS